MYVWVVLAQASHQLNGSTAGTADSSTWTTTMRNTAWRRYADPGSFSFSKDYISI
jgi:hypothetical protein